MKVMVMVKATESSEAGQPPSEELMMEMGRFNEMLVEAGIMRAGDGLKPSSEGIRVRFSGSDRIVTDGPFAETKELVAGYWIWEVGSMDEAVEWVKRCPNPMIEDSDIDIRPLYEVADLEDWDPSGEVASHEEGLRNTIAARESVVHPYLCFGGRCEEALEFYQASVGATVSMMMRYDESPVPIPEGTLQDGFESKIMHATFSVGKTTIMASDGFDDASKLEGFRLALTVANEAVADSAFEALAAEGQVDMPLAKTFWSPRYGVVTDKFGVCWMVMVPGDEQAGPHGDEVGS